MLASPADVDEELPAVTAVAVTEDTWTAAVLHHSKIVIVGVMEPDSGPCRGFETMMDGLAAELAGVATVAIVNLARVPGLARRYDVSSLPTLLVFRGGALAGRLIGARPKERLVQDLFPYLD